MSPVSTCTWPPSSAVEGGRRRLTCCLLQVSGEKRHSQLLQGVRKEGLLRRWRNLVNAAHGQAEETRRSRVVAEGGRHLLGRLDRLVGDSYAANADGVEVDVSRRAAAVAVLDAPGGTCKLPRARARPDIEQLLAVHLVLRCLGAENPQVG